MKEKKMATELLLEVLSALVIVGLLFALAACGRIGVRRLAGPAAAPRIAELKAVYAQRLGAYQE